MQGSLNGWNRTESDNSFNKSLTSEAINKESFQKNNIDEENLVGNIYNCSFSQEEPFAYNDISDNEKTEQNDCEKKTITYLAVYR